MSQSIQPLKKISLSIQAGSDAVRFSLTPSPVVMEFIYGIARNGLSPFELALGGKSSGDCLSFSFSSSEAADFFGNQFQNLRQLIGLHLLPETLYLQVEVATVAEADNREVIQALAGSLANGGCGGGSCDCGCS